MDLFGHGPALLADSLRKCPKRMWLHRPSPNRWSIHEIILHLADSEANSYIRCRQFIAEPGSGALEHNASTWATTLGYFHQSTREALGLVLRLRRMTYQMLRFLPDSVWAHTMQLPRKATVTLEEWIEIQSRHIPHHIEQIHENLNDWSSIHQQRKRSTRLVRRASADKIALA